MIKNKKLLSTLLAIAISSSFVSSSVFADDVVTDGLDESGVMFKVNAAVAFPLHKLDAISSISEVTAGTNGAAATTVVFPGTVEYKKEQDVAFLGSAIVGYRFFNMLGFGVYGFYRSETEWKGARTAVPGTASSLPAVNPPVTGVAAYAEQKDSFKLDAKGFGGAIILTPISTDSIVVDINIYAAANFYDGHLTHSRSKVDATTATDKIGSIPGSAALDYSAKVEKDAKFAFGVSASVLYKFTEFMTAGLDVGYFNYGKVEKLTQEKPAAAAANATNAVTYTMSDKIKDFVLQDISLGLNIGIAF